MAGHGRHSHREGQEHQQKHGHLPTVRLSVSGVDSLCPTCVFNSPLPATSTSGPTPHTCSIGRRRSSQAAAEAAHWRQEKARLVQLALINWPRERCLVAWSRGSKETLLGFPASGTTSPGRWRSKCTFFIGELVVLVFIVFI